MKLNAVEKLFERICIYTYISWILQTIIEKYLSGTLQKKRKKILKCEEVKKKLTCVHMVTQQNSIYAIWFCFASRCKHFISFL